LTKETANEAISELLSALGITKIVFIDDLFAQKVDLADVQAAQLSLTPSQVHSALGSSDLSLADDTEVRRQQFATYWEGLKPIDQVDTGRRILAASDAGGSVRIQDIGAAHALATVVGADQLVTLSRTEWEQQKESFLGDAREGRSLLLFDQDLRSDGGTETGGMAIIANILSTEHSASVMCGLLSHTVTVENETSEWERLAKTNSLECDQFVVIAKENLSADLLQFTRMLKLAALTPDCKKVKERIQQLIEKSTTKAADGVGTINVFEFEHIVLRISQAEGINEQEMLFRLFAIFQRDELRQLAAGDTELSTLLQRLRSVSLIPAKMGTPRLSTWKLQQKEMYESGSHINGLHLPIEIGDVFKKQDNETKQYILLGQPCDLMVRSKGERAPKIKEVILGEISLLGGECGQYDELIPYFGDDPSVGHYVRLKHIYTVPITVLDLCVFNQDGVSRLTETCPVGVHPAWQARHVELKRTLKALMKEYSDAAQVAKQAERAKFTQKLYSRFPPLVGRDGLFQLKVVPADDSQSLEFNCIRSRRLHRPRAAALALNYASVFSRPAFDRDLGDISSFAGLAEAKLQNP
jgi:hypothetical protein